MAEVCMAKENYVAYEIMSWNGRISVAYKACNWGRIMRLSNNEDRLAVFLGPGSRVEEMQG